MSTVSEEEGTKKEKKGKKEKETTAEWRRDDRGVVM